MKNVLIISSSPRKISNSDMLCREFEKGAKEAGHHVDYVRLSDEKIGYCIGCYSCHKTGKCFQNDSMTELREKIMNADVIVFATPVYFYTMSAQLKTFIDRFTPFYEDVRADIYIFATAWDSNLDNLQNTVEAVRGLTRDCLEDCEEKGVVCVGGLSGIGDIAGRSELKTAYEMGKNC